MKIGISTASFSRYETEDALKLLHEVGAETCEIFLKTFYEYRPEFAKKFCGNTNGVEVNSIRVQSNNFEPQLFFHSRRERGDGYYWLDQLMRSAQLFGAKKYTFRGILRRETLNDFDSVGWCLNKISEFCAEYGVNLCLENVRWSTYFKPKVFSELKRRCPSLYGVLNIEQARKSGYPYAMYLQEMAGSISHVHISDVDENGIPCLPGEGLYNFYEIFVKLKDIGFDGAVLIDTANFQNSENIKRSIEFLNEIIYKLK